MVVNEQDLKQEFAERLKTACDNKGLPSKGRGKMIAEAINVSERTVSMWSSGKHLPSPLHIYPLAKYLAVTKEWLLFGFDNFSLPYGDETAETIDQIPVLSLVQAGKLTEARALTNTDGDYIMGTSHVLSSGKAFFVKIEGDSMEPDFIEGDIVKIDPELVPESEDLVVAVDENYNATFKKYNKLNAFTKDGVQHFELIPINKAYKAINTIDQPIAIVGVAIESSRKLRRR